MSGFSNLPDNVLLSCVLASLVASVAVCATDAKHLGKSPWHVGLMVILLFPIGVVVWRAMRSKIVKTESKRRLDPENLRMP